MHEFFHIFGLCADHDAHLNFLSILNDNALTQQIGSMFRRAHSYIKRKK